MQRSCFGRRRPRLQLQYILLTLSLPNQCSIPSSSLEDTPPLPNALGAGPKIRPLFSFAISQTTESFFGLLRLPHQTSTLRRVLRTIGRSTESTRNPKGTIQKPRIGRKPTSPPRTSNMPITRRQIREPGSEKEYRPILIRGRGDDTADSVMLTGEALAVLFDMDILAGLR
jgi:hypothetical protein